MKRWVLLLSFLVNACASLSAPAASPLFDDRLLAKATVRIDPAAIMALTPEMRRYLAREVAGASPKADMRRVLLDALYSRSKLRLEYEGGTTRTAGEAFDARAGNCLSLVLMTAAFAKELGIEPQYQRVLIDDVWSRGSGLYFASGHINLSLGPAHRGFANNAGQRETLTVDFIPAKQVRSQRMLVVSERTVLAMFMNNRAAESLASGRLPDAYAWARAAIQQEPRYYDAYNTLAVVYLRAGDFGLAERVLSTVLTREPNNTKVMANMVAALNLLGRRSAAVLMAKRLSRLEPVRPFQLFDAGVREMSRGNYRRARELFEGEIARESTYHEFHFWLALANYELGDMRGARDQLKLARDLSPSTAQHDVYAAKLSYLKALEHR